jgi:ribosomal protein S14
VHAAQPRAGETRRRAMFNGPDVCLSRWHVCHPPEHIGHVMLIRSRSSDDRLAESGDARIGRLFRSLVEHSATMRRSLKPRAVTSQLIPEDTSYVARGHSASFVCGRAHAVLRDVMLAVARGCLRDVPGRQRCALSVQQRKVHRCEGPLFGPLGEKEHVNQAKLLRVVLPFFCCGQCCRAHRGALRHMPSNCAHNNAAKGRRGAAGTPGKGTRMRDRPALLCQTRRTAAAKFCGTRKG